MFAYRPGSSVLSPILLSAYSAYWHGIDLGFFSTVTFHDVTGNVSGHSAFIH